MSSLTSRASWDLIDGIDVIPSGLRPYTGHWHRLASGLLSPSGIRDVLFLHHDNFTDEVSNGFVARRRIACDDIMLPVDTLLLHHVHAYKPRAADFPVVAADLAPSLAVVRRLALACFGMDSNLLPSPVFLEHMDFMYEIYVGHPSPPGDVNRVLSTPHSRELYPVIASAPLPGPRYIGTRSTVAAVHKARVDHLSSFFAHQEHTNGLIFDAISPSPFRSSFLGGFTGLLSIQFAESCRGNRRVACRSICRAARWYSRHSPCREISCTAPA